VYPIAIAAIVPLLLSLLPLYLLIQFAIRHHVDVPFYDQWALVPRLEALDAGTLTVREVWEQHGEHRPMIPVMVMIVLARLTGWNIGWEIALNVVLGAAMFAIVARYATAAFAAHGGAAWWLLPFAAVLFFSRAQWENWLWGWQMTALMGSLAAMTGVYLLTAARPRRWTFAAAVACGVWCLYSFGAGLVYWAIGPLAIWLGPRGSRGRRVTIWIAAAAVTMTTYFYGYHAIPRAPLPFAADPAGTAVLLAKYVCVFLGGSIAWYDQRFAQAAGIVAVLGFAALSLALRRHHADPAFRFPFVLGLQTIGIAMLSALGRASMGIEQAMSSRYTTFGMSLWFALAALAVLGCRLDPRPVARLQRALVTSLAALAVAASAVVSSQEGARIGAGRAETLRFARRGLMVGRSDALMGRLYPDAAVVRQRRRVLLKLHLSVFRTSPSTTYPIPDSL